jgi:hypothetical protein
MARSQTVQFGWFKTSAEARSRLDALDKTGDLYGDRVSIGARLRRVASREEIARNEAFLQSLGYHGPWRAYGRDTKISERNDTVGPRGVREDESASGDGYRSEQSWGTRRKGLERPRNSRPDADAATGSGISDSELLRNPTRDERLDLWQTE